MAFPPPAAAATAPAATPELELAHYLQHHHGLSITFSPSKGRCLLALRPFRRGHLIFQHEPYVATLDAASQASRCDRCFRPPSSSPLQRCSACKTVFYCSADCQRREWGHHKFECRILVRLLKEKQRTPTSTMRLVLRLLIKRRLQADKVLSKTALDNYQICEALLTHMSETGEDLLVMYAQMARIVQQMVSPDEVNVKEVTQTICRFACNAHTICDEEVRPLGTGFYPVISIINHSCLPNAVLHFDGNRAAVRAVDDIHEGTEITISYVELAASTTTRRKALKDQYYFDCNCIRCSRMDSLAGLREDALLEGYKCINSNCDGALIAEIGRDKISCNVCGCKRDVQEAKIVAMEVELKALEASNLYSAGNLESARRLYVEVEAMQINLFHSHSVCLLRTHDALLKICMEMKDWTAALEYCQSTIPAYERAYPPFFPLLGLQYFTLGKLQWLQSYSASAIHSLEKAYSILQVTHGFKSSLLQSLTSTLQEAHAEVAYKDSLVEHAH
ncbi:hypothetical protein KC19_11G000800 [Ceratodon purpureus]|uniref:Uncharacterized protein n=1 Tax=Ceratodon purpureus TaxID=3225 RepID=A0A8T0G970_CERPU|nr:hypothetical protein KC19_11G000800 [Ceratodon purpureus]